VQFAAKLQYQGTTHSDACPKTYAWLPTVRATGRTLSDSAVAGQLLLGRASIQCHVLRARWLHEVTTDR